MKIKDYMTIKEAAEFLGVSTATLRAWDNSNKLKAYRIPINRSRYYKEEDLQKLLDSMDESKYNELMKDIK